MKRSEINRAIREGEAFMEAHRFFLPPFTRWTPEEWREKGPECDEIRRCGLGWDVTDFGRGDFRRYGLLLVTLRNGLLEEKASGGKEYAEKIMVMKEGQVTPCHFHWHKEEDIINRAGGEMVLKLWKSDAKEERIDDPLKVQKDGVTHELKGGEKIRLKPGESITLEQGIYHEFWAEGETCLVGEVSSVNDDSKDNRFLEKEPRFSRIQEDEPPYRLLVNEYP